MIRETFTPTAASSQLVVAPLNWLVITFCGVAVVLLGLLPG